MEDFKSSEQLKGMTTPRLLAYYKAVRKRNINEDDEDVVRYLKSIKKHLDDREHVK